MSGNIVKTANIVTWPQVVLFGDSLTQNSFDPDKGKWGAMLAHKFRGCCDVVNRGFSGYNSAFCRKILPHIFSKQNSSEIRAFVVLLGTNDCSGSEAQVLNVPLEEYKENLDSIIVYLLGIGIDKEKIILATPPPYSDEKYGKFCLEIGRFKHFRDLKVLGEYVSTCVDVATKHGLEVVNLYEELMKDENWPDCLVDGLHFGVKGSEKVFNLLCPLIEKRVEVTKFVFPYWREFDVNKF